MSQEDPKRRYETERTRRFRRASLSKRDELTIAQVETYGCSVVHVKRSAAGFGWSYTIGIFDTCGWPELVTVGLHQDTAHFLLNEAAKRLRSGADLAEGRQSGLLGGPVGELDCMFRPVDPKWIKQLMGWARWYYDGSDFPVLQAIYPDREGRFAQEPGFNKDFTQPLLQPDAPLTAAERDFWASTDPDSSLYDWQFPDPPHTAAFLSEAVQSGAEPITYVSHDAEDGTWQFLGDSMANSGEPVLSCLHHPIDNDFSLKELADLPRGWYARRAKPGEPWIRQPHDSDEE